jgi:hypothetical protein
MEMEMMKEMEMEMENHFDHPEMKMKFDLLEEMKMMKKKNLLDLFDLHETKKMMMNLSEDHETERMKEKEKKRIGRSCGRDRRTRVGFSGGRDNGGGRCGRQGES